MSSGTENNSCEGSDESSESELLDRSLSVWRGRVAINEDEDFVPCPLDIHTASSIGHYECVRSILVRNEVNIDCRNKGGWTPLMYASYIGHENILNLLLKANANVNISNYKGQTSLMLASSCGNERVSYFLFQHGSDLEAVDKRGWTSLFHATYAGHQNVVKFLLENNANLNAREPSLGMTPFMEAAAGGHEIIVQLLLQHGVHFNAKTIIGDTARSLALINGYMKIVSLIDQHVAMREDPARLLAAPQLPRHPINWGVRTKESRASPNIRDGPDAFARIIEQSRKCDVQNYGRLPDQIRKCDVPTFPTTSVPEGYVTFPRGNAEETYLRYRDVTSPINPQDHNLDSSGGKDSCDNEDESTVFSQTGALTIKSSSGSSGGLAAALQLSHSNSSDSDDVVSSSFPKSLLPKHEYVSGKLSKERAHQTLSQPSVIPKEMLEMPRDDALGLAHLEISSSNNQLNRGYSSDPCRLTWGTISGDSVLNSNHDRNLFYLDTQYKIQSDSAKRHFTPHQTENNEMKSFPGKEQMSQNLDSCIGSPLSIYPSDLIVDPYIRTSNLAGQYANFPVIQPDNNTAGQFLMHRSPSQNESDFPSDKLDQNHLHFLSTNLGGVAPPTNFPAVSESNVVRDLYFGDKLDSFSQQWLPSHSSNSNNNDSLFTDDTQNNPNCPPATLQTRNVNPVDSPNLPVSVTPSDMPSDKPQTLVELLQQLGLLKYLPVFEEQDVDLQVFLSLTDNDLKEIGIKLFGPRRKMASAIARWHSNVRTPCDGLERAYADRLEAEMQEMAIQLHQANSQVKLLEAEILQEQKLRSVTEGCFMEERALRQRERCRMEEICCQCQQLQEAFEQLRYYRSELHEKLLNLISGDVKKEPCGRETIPLDSSFLKELDVVKKMDICSNELKQKMDFISSALNDLLLQENISPAFVPTAFS
ncbi:ankyrin repeat and SAM domain-containing protein 3 isoform X1 [Octopus bimaculoides]|uniref:SAM domain-containing protein n=1 Tax=Octopus bimaculoides TaxID=37653 RepID=A0A0L8G2Y4_OCTBM|nr:ankyrin repeat and SAM domain-containing protein 3 isoform X1 [Octopus bimaculoides]|eukprot:XP_014784896.1 PREDICTED: ankyrin repeat and SAM domain-containing protein 3-like isoform X1 [Octopus bimaculoides]